MDKIIQWQDNGRNAQLPDYINDNIKSYEIKDKTNLEIDIALHGEVSMSCWLVISIESLFVEIRIFSLCAISWWSQPKRFLIVN